MKTPAKLLLTFAATCFALFGTARAQLQTYTTETLSSWVGNTVNFQPSISEGTLGETFSGVGQITSLTYAFVSSSPTPASGTLSYTFGQWNGSNITSTLSFGSLTVNSANFTTPLAGSFVNVTDGSFNFSAYSLDPTKSYALLLTSATNQSFGLGWIGGNTYAYGKSFDSAGNFGTNVDYAFAYISVEVPPTYVPESSTIASLLAAALVAGLVGYRVYQRRKLALAPALIASAA